MENIPRTNREEKNTIEIIAGAMTETRKDTSIQDDKMSHPITKEYLVDLLRESQQHELRNEFKESLELTSEAWQHFQNTPSVQDDILKSEILSRLCQTHLQRQDYHKVDEYSEELLQLSRKLGDAETEVQALTNIAICKSVDSDYRAAMPLFVEALEKSRQLKMRNNEVKCLINIGNIYANLFNYDEALNRYNTVLNEYQDVLNDNTRIIINLNSGNLYYVSEDYKASINCCEDALTAAKTAQQTDKATHAHVLLSRSWLALGVINNALFHTRKATEIAQELGRNFQGRAIHLLNMAQITFEMKDTEGSILIAKKGIAAARRVKDDASELRGFRLLADIFIRIKEYPLAIRCQMLYSHHQENYLKMQREMRALDIEIKYALREKEAKIEELIRENQFQAMLIESNSQIEKQNEQLRLANEELQQFAYITSHDLKEPLRMIGSFTQIIERQYAAKIGEESKQYFHFISDGVTRMHALLDALLQYATIGKVDLELETVNMTEMVNIACRNLHLKIEESGATVEVEPLPSVRAVGTFMIQLFQNLIGNALKFKKEDTKPILKISAKENGSDWQFSVEDNGIGIQPEHRERVFVIFQRLHTRARYEGTGIGLAICQKIISQLGGRIWVESEYGQGATFNFTVPK